MCASLLCASLLVGHAEARNVWLSLNVEFNNPFDLNSGGTWTVVTKADERGLAGIVFYLDATSVNFNPATGFLTPIGYENAFSSNNGLRIEVVQGDDPLFPTYDVGVIGGPYPTTYVDDPSLVPFGGNPDLGSFTGGVELVTGTFNAGDIPSWYSVPPDIADANVYLNTFSAPVQAPVSLTVRANYIPEPASLLLLGGGVIALATIRRR